MELILILNENITINYKVDQQDIMRYNQLLQLGTVNGTDEFQTVETIQSEFEL